MKLTINDICKGVLNITEAEVLEQKEIFKGQADYHNPLKMATTSKQHRLSEYNNSVLNKILELKKLIESGKDMV